MGHISEIADATEPFQPRGCPFQAWSLSEFIRVKKMLGMGKKVSAETGTITQLTATTEIIGWGSESTDPPVAGTVQFNLSAVRISSTKSHTDAPTQLFELLARECKRPPH